MNLDSGLIYSTLPPTPGEPLKQEQSKHAAPSAFAQTDNEITAAPALQRVAVNAFVKVPVKEYFTPLFFPLWLRVLIISACCEDCVSIITCVYSVTSW